MLFECDFHVLHCIQFLFPHVIGSLVIGLKCSISSLLHPKQDVTLT